MLAATKAPVPLLYQDGRCAGLPPAPMPSRARVMLSANSVLAGAQSRITQQSTE